MKKNCKIVMMTMFKNESKVIRRMLESCAPYIDVAVIQNNGSTDGTDKIVKQFFEEKQIPCYLYDVEEGWVGFGWNRDHLTKTVQSLDHGCDWILKMDCDETLEVYDNFDWSILDDRSVQAWHVPAIAGTCVYYRAWMYNASLPWRFNHDPCHETVYCDDPLIGNNFQIKDLPIGFNQVNSNEGQSWGVPTKFISDSLILEEKMIKENTMLNDWYHFWYIGKSYIDAYPCTNGFPLGLSQQKEYARRAVYYLYEYIKQRYPNENYPTDEMSYMGIVLAAEAQTFLEEYDEAVKSYHLADKFASGRNDHWIGLTYLYEKLEKWDKMLEITNILMQPERTNPFPQYCNFIDSSMYLDSPTVRVQTLHNEATQKVKDTPKLPFYINKLPQKRLFVVDNFYSNPDEIRHYALNRVEYKQDLRWYKGHRSTTSFHPEGIKEAFEKIIGEPITKFDTGTVNGCFQIMTSSDPQVWHYDEQKWAAMIYLTPNAPIVSGTRLHHGKNNIRHKIDIGVDDYFNGNFYDSTKWDIADSVGNFYNRLVIMDAQCVHSAGPYFGDNFNNGRLTHLFFFD